jgi:peptide/nickel transport system ATP-binding protein
MKADDPLLRVEDLRVWFGSAANPIRAVDGVSLSVPAGRTVALVGESGSGKSVTALSLARLVPQPPGFIPGGRILFGGEDVLRMSGRRLAQIRGGDIAYVFQEPATALNPVLRVGWQIMEAVRLHRPDTDARAEAPRLMGMVGLPDPERRMRSYPHELSGGMQQRVMIAMALASRPRLLVADEPTTALDVTIQAQILELLGRLQQELRMAVLLITHNLGLVAGMAHSVAVMYAGRIVEDGPAEDVLTQPAHPYTRGLLEAVPRLVGAEPERGGGAARTRARLRGIPGTVPHPARLPAGCKFAPRCPLVRDVCRREDPAVREAAGGRLVRCGFPLGAQGSSLKYGDTLS